MSVADTTATGDRRASLEAIRQVIALTLEEAEPSNRAALAKELRAVIAELDSLAVPEVSALDDLAAARRARLSAPVPKRAPAPDKRGSGSDRPGGKRRATA